MFLIPTYRDTCFRKEVLCEEQHYEVSLNISVTSIEKYT